MCVFVCFVGTRNRFAIPRGFTTDGSFYPGDEVGFYYSSSSAVLLQEEIRLSFDEDVDYWDYLYIFLNKLSLNTHDYSDLKQVKKSQTKNMWSNSAQDSPDMIVEPDASGTYNTGQFGYGTARAWLTIGQLILNDGVWGSGNDTVRLLPEGWVRQLRQPFDEFAKCNNTNGVKYGQCICQKCPISHTLSSHAL